MEMLGWIDLLAAGIVLVSAIFAFHRGFVREVLAIASWVGSVVFAVYFFDAARPHVAEYLPDELLINIATGAGLFVGSLVIFWLAIHLVVAHVKASALSTLDRSLGFLFGIARGVIVVAVAFIGGEKRIWNEEEDTRPDWLESARSLPLIEYTARQIVAFIPEEWEFPVHDILPATPEELARPPIATADTPAEDPGYSNEVRTQMERAIEGTSDETTPETPAPAGTVPETGADSN
jgi:membrane protein required for colicin V production